MSDALSSYGDLHGVYYHQDGPKLHNAYYLPVCASLKADGRGNTIIHRVFWGEAFIDWYGRNSGWYGVLAIPADVHHVVMNPEQLRDLGKYLIRLAGRVQARRDEKDETP